MQSLGYRLWVFGFRGCGFGFILGFRGEACQSLRPYILPFSVHGLASQV